jgi:hypothetical protein
MKTGRYVLIYDQRDVRVPPEVVTAFIKNSKDIVQWSQLYPGAFLLKSDRLATELTSAFNDILAPADFLFISIDKTTNDKFDGLLKPEIWRWFSLNNDDDLKALEV